MSEYFEVGETVIMHSPFTGEDTEVNYRGPAGDKAVVVMGSSQFSVPFEWLKKKDKDEWKESYDDLINDLIKVADDCVWCAHTKHPSFETLMELHDIILEKVNTLKSL